MRQAVLVSLGATGAQLMEIERPVQIGGGESVGMVRERWLLGDHDSLGPGMVVVLQSADVDS